jgi:hypothetical protein
LADETKNPNVHALPLDLASLLTDVQYENTSGKYFDRGKETRSSELSYNKVNAVNLWERSIKLTQLQKDETIFTI